MFFDDKFSKQICGRMSEHPYRSLVDLLGQESVSSSSNLLRSIPANSLPWLVLTTIVLSGSYLSSRSE